jgi:glutaredoxin
MALLLVCAGLALAYAIRELAQGSPATGSPPSQATAPARSEPRREAPRSRAAAPASNLYYQYVDGANQVQFARSLEEVPEEWRGRAGRVSLPVPPPASPARKTAAREPRRSAAAMHAEGTFSAARSSERGSQPEIEIYTMKSCGYCRAAMKYMDERGIEYTNRDIEDEPEARDEYLEKTGGRAGVPVIDIEGEILQGWSQQHFDTVLASRRQ